MNALMNEFDQTFCENIRPTEKDISGDVRVSLGSDRAIL